MNLIWIVILVLIVGVAIFAIMSYNGLVAVKNKVEAAWAQIEVQLNRRHDLIPNLVETVKGYAGHEQETLEAVINARNASASATGPAEQAQAQDMISGALSKLFALSEAYPDLKANQNFLSLQAELSDTENRIAYSRQYYSDSVKIYNTKIEAFPGMFVAKPMGYGPREYFQAEGAAREPVQVQF